MSFMKLFHGTVPAVLTCLSSFPGVTGPPGAPEGLVVTDISETNVQLSWSSGADNHSPITMYVVQTRTPFSIGWQTVRTGISPLSQCFHPSIQGTISLSQCNIIGKERSTDLNRCVSVLDSGGYNKSFSSHTAEVFPPRADQTRG